MVVLAPCSGFVIWRLGSGIPLGLLCVMACWREDWMVVAYFGWCWRCVQFFLDDAVAGFVGATDLVVPPAAWEVCCWAQRPRGVLPSLRISLYLC